MRDRHKCPHHLPWTTTSQGEIDDACIDRERRIIKRCDGCREETKPKDKNHQ